MGMAGECTPGHVAIRDRTDLGGAVGGVAGSNGIVAVVDGNAESWLGENRDLTTTSNAVSIVSLGESVRSTTVDAGTTTPLPDVKGVQDVDDLAALGRHVTETVSMYDEQGLTPIIVFDAVDELVDTVGLEATFRVIHLLSARARSTGGRLVTILPESMPRSDANTIAALAD